MASQAHLSGEGIVSIFTELTDWEKRKAGEKEFFIDLLRSHKCHRIFDSCVGDGYDSIRLLESGFSVEGNDLDPLFREMAGENLSQRGYAMNINQYDWRELPSSLDGKFDAVICLGNSLTYLFDAQDREKTIKNFARIVRPGGLVIVDQRNYDYMLDQREHILENPLKNFRYSCRFYYCNPTSRMFPTLINDSEILLTYFKNGKRQKNSLSLFPIRKAELASQMTKAGLQSEVYGDFVKDNPDHVDFYQHVGVKL